MGQKVNPIIMRLGITRESDSSWYANGSDYAKFIHEDFKIRNYILKLKSTGISRVMIERANSSIILKIHAKKSGAIFSKKGNLLAQIKEYADKISGKNTQIDIIEVKKPNWEARIIAENIGDKILTRVAPKKAIQNALETIGVGAKIYVSGRLGGAEIARTEWVKNGSVPLHTLNNNIDCAKYAVTTPYGQIGIKVIINRPVDKFMVVPIKK